MSLLSTYFPSLSAAQLAQFDAMVPLYREWNERINVISRKDIENLEERHILHSLAIAKIVTFKAGAKVLDLGTGGGFPGIPLAILFPDTHFHLVDGTQKKIKVVAAVAEALGLKNVEAEAIRAEDIKKRRYDFVVSRAVARLEKLMPWARPRIELERHLHTIPNGLITLKGGQIKEEISALGRREYVESYPMQDFFPLPTFEDKYIIYVQA